MVAPAQPNQVYNVANWGEGCFSIDANGALCVRPNGSSGGSATLADVLSQCNAAQLREPVLVRFSGILRQRVKMLAAAFRDTIAAQDYGAGYTPVYPIKVNQQRRVVDEILRARDDGESIGLEAGSKPELLAVLALSSPGDTIVCNGYKDEEYLRLALMGEKLGFHVHIVVEKTAELPRLLDLADELGVTPRIGLRVRLMSVSKGNWQNTGGEKSKFGLSASQLMAAVALCRERGKLDWLNLLHFHLGSQVANIQDIKAGLREAARYYTELRRLGADISVVDVGGGLGVDYEGTHSRSYCSMNYSMADYAFHIVQTLHEHCLQQNQPAPHIISESGRALTAHHAVLLVNITDQERQTFSEVSAPSADAPTELQRLWSLQQTLQDGNANLLEVHPDLSGTWQDVSRRYIAGELSLAERALGEQLYINGLLLLQQQLNPLRRQQRDLLDHLNGILADKLFVNFSVFQSVPDVWGIAQIFPILPLTGLNQPITRRAVLQDITCDSDGRIDQFVDGEGVENALPLPEQVGDHLGIFMVGAYQEILGDMHNLFGDTDSVDVDVDADGTIHLSHPIQGDTVSDVLQYVNYNPERLLHRLEQHCQQAHLSAHEQQGFVSLVRDGLNGYTYLE